MGIEPADDDQGTMTLTWHARPLDAPLALEPPDPADVVHEADLAGEEVPSGFPGCDEKTTISSLPAPSTIIVDAALLPDP
jgi:hypothetical protein